MGKRKTVFYLIMVMLVVMAWAYLTPSAVEAKENCYIITFQGKNGLTPNKLEIDQGDCVVWVNWTGSASHRFESEVLIKFDEDSKCIDAIQSPVVGFALEPKSGCFTSKALGYGDTASLVFTRPGVYAYKLESKTGTTQEGQVLVK